MCRKDFSIQLGRGLVFIFSDEVESFYRKGLKYTKANSCLKRIVSLSILMISGRPDDRLLHRRTEVLRFSSSVHSDLKRIMLECHILLV